MNKQVLIDFIKSTKDPNFIEHYAALDHLCGKIRGMTQQNFDDYLRDITTSGDCFDEYVQAFTMCKECESLDYCITVDGYDEGELCRNCCYKLCIIDSNREFVVGRKM